MAWTPVFSKFLKIQPFVWNRTLVPGRPFQNCRLVWLPFLELHRRRFFSYPKKVTCVDFRWNFAFLPVNKIFMFPGRLSNSFCCFGLSVKDSTSSRAETWLTVYRPYEVTRRALRSKSNSAAECFYSKRGEHILVAKGIFISVFLIVGSFVWSGYNFSMVLLVIAWCCFGERSWLSL